MSDENLTTVAVLIGNSDNKLTQERWSDFVDVTRSVLESFTEDLFFQGGEPYDSIKQRCCTVLSVDTARLPDLRKAIDSVRNMFGQDSIAMLSGETELIGTTSIDSASGAEKAPLVAGLLTVDEQDRLHRGETIEVAVPQSVAYATTVSAIADGCPYGSLGDVFTLPLRPSVRCEIVRTHYKLGVGWSIKIQPLEDAEDG